MSNSVGKEKAFEVCLRKRCSSLTLASIATLLLASLLLPESKSSESCPWYWAVSERIGSIPISHPAFFYPRRRPSSTAVHTPTNNTRLTTGNHEALGILSPLTWGNIHSREPTGKFSLQCNIIYIYMYICWYPIRRYRRK